MVKNLNQSIQRKKCNKEDKQMEPGSMLLFHVQSEQKDSCFSYLLKRRDTGQGEEAILVIAE